MYIVPIFWQGRHACISRWRYFRKLALFLDKTDSIFLFSANTLSRLLQSSRKRTIMKVFHIKIKAKLLFMFTKVIAPFLALISKQGCRNSKNNNVVATALSPFPPSPPSPSCPTYEFFKSVKTAVQLCIRLHQLRLEQDHRLKKDGNELSNLFYVHIQDCLAELNEMHKSVERHWIFWSIGFMSIGFFLYLKKWKTRILHHKHTLESIGALVKVAACRYQYMLAAVLDKSGVLAFKFFREFCSADLPNALLRLQLGITIYAESRYLTKISADDQFYTF